MLWRSLSAAAQRVAFMPEVAPFFISLLLRFTFAIALSLIMAGHYITSGNSFWMNSLLL
jgi:hypothetical protein